MHSFYNSPHHPEANGQVENTNREIEKNFFLRSYVKMKKKNKKIGMTLLPSAL